jgi:uncharacterized protein (TIGR00369 family)
MIDFVLGVVVIHLPYAAHLVGNPDTGVLHGGGITALLDAASGACVFLKIMKPVPVATLDLRIDYLRPAEPPRDVLARAECYHITRNVAFVRAVAYHDDPANPIASSVGTFMLQTAGMSVIDRAALTFTDDPVVAASPKSGRAANEEKAP